jgi:Protein involved in cell division
MKKTGRYDTSGLIENQYEPGSNKQVLKNLLGIKNKQEIDKIEVKELLRVTKEMTEYYYDNHCFTAADICYMHHSWLGSIYEWAGSYRNVTMMKDNFPFAAPALIPKLMDEFEKEILCRYTPCNFNSRYDVVMALVVVHTELLLIHPFREGNGRIARLLAIIMALQAKLPFLDFSDLKDQKKDEYFEAVRAGMERDYKPMEKIFSDVTYRSLKYYDEE